MTQDDGGFPRNILNPQGNNPFGGGGDGGGVEIDPEAVGRTVLTVFVLVLIAAIAWSSYYQIAPDEEGVVLRFGRYHKTTQPGPHFKIPLGVDQVLKVPTQRQMKMEFGFRTDKVAQRTSYRRGKEALAESEMLTGDLNVADVEWVVQYHIHDPQAYLFRAREIDEVIQDLSEAVMRQAVGDVSVNDLLTGGREALAANVKSALAEATAHYDLGITVDQLIIQDVNPPEAVKPSFNEVNQAQQEKERAINEAMAQYNNLVPQARGKAEQKISQARGYAAERVNGSKGDVASFLAVQKAYARSPKVTRTRLQLETLQKVLPGVKDKWVVTGAGSGILQHLKLGK